MAMYRSLLVGAGALVAPPPTSIAALDAELHAAASDLAAATSHLRPAEERLSVQLRYDVALCQLLLVLGAVVDLSTYEDPAAGRIEHEGRLRRARASAVPLGN